MVREACCAEWCQSPMVGGRLCAEEVYIPLCTLGVYMPPCVPWCTYLPTLVYIPPYHTLVYTTSPGTPLYTLHPAWQRVYIPVLSRVAGEGPWGLVLRLILEKEEMRRRELAFLLLFLCLSAQSYSASPGGKNTPIG